MNIIWGYDNRGDILPSSNKRRKIDESKKYIEIDNDLIYTFDTEIHFTGPIDSNSISKIIKEITKIIHNKKLDKKYNNEKKLEISYVVDSGGGCVNSVLKFVDFIRIVKKKYPNIEFTSIGTGLIASAATIMCAVADKRYMTHNADAMLHELSSGNYGKFTHLMSYTTYLSKTHDKLVNIYLEKSKMNKEEINELLKNETWFTSSEYLKKGLIDELK